MNVSVTRGARLLRLAERTKTFVKPKGSSKRTPVTIKSFSKKKPAASSNAASLNNIAKTIQALENLKTPSRNQRVHTNKPATRTSTRERKAPKRFGFNNNNNNTMNNKKKTTSKRAKTR